MFLKIPTIDYTTKVKGHREFETREELIEFLTSIFKEPGKYEFDEATALFNEEAVKFNSKKSYCTFPFRSKDFIEYWDDQKEKCIKGLIITHGSKTWFLPRGYYMWLNFLPIYNKEVGKFTFPSIRDAQYHMALYEEIAQLSYKHGVILKKRQIASEQPHSEPVLGEHGWTTMGDIQIGDKLWNPDGTLTTIIAKSNNGVSDVYEFSFLDGRTTRCGIEHNWEVYDKKDKTTKVLNTKQLIREGFTLGKAHRFSIRCTEPIEFKNVKPLPIDPYVLGCILGDGSISSGVYVSGADNEIFDEIRLALGDDYSLNNIGYLKWSITYNKRFGDERELYENGSFGINPILRALDDLGLRVDKRTGKKFIPDIYLNGSITDRIEILQGLMDTDGYVNAQGNNIHFTNKNKELAEGVAYIARSLGLRVTVKTKENKHGLFYRVLFSGDIHCEIFRLSRKQNRFIKRVTKKVHSLIPLTGIKKLKYQEESSCIVVDNPNRLYITRDFIVTHNSYFHAAVMINFFWFDEGAVIKMAASLKNYINESGTWRFLEEYRNFLNSHTAWYRPCNPDKVLNWQQKIEVTEGGRKYDRGLKSSMIGLALDKDPAAGVGGPTRFFFFEEAGIAPKMDQTLEFLLPSLKSGMIYTGYFVAAGSVGDLDQCEPLRELIYNPDSKDVLAVETNLLNATGEIAMCALFIPEQWSMLPCIDSYGNSLVEEALKMILEERIVWKKTLAPNQYQLRISQKPINIEEAFAARKDSKFMSHLVAAQIRRIEDGEYFKEYVDLYRDETNKILYRPSRRTPIKEFPISPKTINKEGVLVVYEHPCKDPKFGMYYASIDPVGEGKTTSSESLCSIYVYKTKREVTRYKQDGSIEQHIERDGIVASWCGRYDDLTKTHEMLELIVEYYNAWTLVENNISLFIQHMVKKRKQRYLIPKQQILFLKELGSNANVFQEYGWKNTGNLFKSHLISYAQAFTQEEIDQQTDVAGNVTKVMFGIERIPDIMLLKEMQAYRDGLNVDRLVAFCSLVAFATVQESNRGYTKRIEHDVEPLQNSDKNAKLFQNPFRNVGVTPTKYKTRSAFKNIR